MSLRAKRQTGQALLLVTLALIALCGILGLAVDLGWSYFQKKSAQAAADSAALAAVAAAQRLGLSQPFTCGNTTGQIYCSTSPRPCGNAAIAGNLASACTYAGLNGFTQGGDTNILVQADVTTPAPTVPNVKVSYWVTVRVNRQIPQLFSAVLGNTTGLVSARATAALTNVIFDASLTLLNRQLDNNSAMGTGVDLSITGGGNIQAPGGMLVSSTLNGNGGGNAAANLNSQSSSVTNTPWSNFRGGPGSCMGNGNNNCDVGSASGDWSQPPLYNQGTGANDPHFMDPTSLGSAKTQPPLNTSSTNVCPVPGGILTPTNVPTCAVNGTALGPGMYYASTSSTDTTATGGQLTFTATTTTFNSGSSFGQYVFYGGLTTSAGTQTIVFAPGTYVLAGTTSSTTPLLSIDNGTTIKDGNTGASQTDAGEMFIFTNGNYGWAAGSSLDGSTTWNSGGLANMAPSAIRAYGPSNFQYGQGGFSNSSGNDQSRSSITLSGLNPAGTGVPSTGSAPLTSYKDFLFWQDRRNSTIHYNDNGTYDTGPCGAGTALENGAAPPGPDNVCTGESFGKTSPQMNLYASPNVKMNGYIYQPRGAWLSLQGSGQLAGGLRIITGALTLGGHPVVSLTGQGAPLTITETALIE